MDVKKRWLGYGIISGITLLTVIGICFNNDMITACHWCILFLACFSAFYGSISYRLTHHVILPHVIFFLPLLVCVILIVNLFPNGSVYLLDFLLCLIFTCLPSLFFSVVTRHFVKRKIAPCSNQKRNDYLMLGAQLVSIMVWFLLANGSFLDDIVSDEILVGIILLLNLLVSLIQYGICAYRLTERILIPSLILLVSLWMVSSIVLFVEASVSFGVRLNASLTSLGILLKAVATTLYGSCNLTAISLVFSALTKCLLRRYTKNGEYQMK